MTLSEIKALDNQYFLGVFGERAPVCFVRGEGTTLYDQDGKAYTDFFAGIAVNALGYNHPAVTNAVIAQAQRGVLHTSNLYYVQPQAELAKLLCENTFASRVFFGNSGAEANEGAIKLARKYFYVHDKKRYKVVSADHSFHGRTLATIAATGHDYYQAPYRPLLPAGISQVPYNDIDAMRKAVDEETAAILIEPLQGEGGVTPATREYLTAVRKLCDETGTLLILDEVQTGVHRTGSLYCHTQYGVIPDIMTSAKGLGCGFPIGAILVSEKVAQTVSVGDHGSTFGGNTFACSVSLSVMRYMLEHDFSTMAREKGAYLTEQLGKLNNPRVTDIRGMGLLQGVQLDAETSAKAVCGEMLHRGFVVGTAAGNVVRIIPPLVIEKEKIAAFVQTLSDVIDAQ